jgi:hypothetical protein
MQSLQQTFASNNPETIAGSNGWPALQDSHQPSSLYHVKFLQLQISVTLLSKAVHTPKHSTAASPNEPVNHKSVDYRAFKRAFQALRNQSLPLDIALIR